MIKRLNDKSILYLEDDEVILSSTSKILNYFVKTVHECKNTTDARDILNSHEIDIIVTDIILNDEISLDLIEEVRKTNNFIPIVIISGHTDRELLLRAIPLKLMSYLIKPIQYEELIHSLIICSTELCLQAATNSTSISSVLNNGYYYSSERKVLIKQNMIHPLTQKESRFIELLVNNHNRLITKEMLRDFVWREDIVNDQTIANLLTRIRKRFGKSFIYTIRDLGYRLHR